MTDRIVRRYHSGDFYVVELDWEPTPRWLQFFGKPKWRRHMMISPCDPPGMWFYSDERKAF